MRRILTAIVLAGVLSACGTSDTANAPAATTSAPTAVTSSITVSGVWARPAGAMAGVMSDAKPTDAASAMGEGGANGAMYLTISNSGGAPDRLVKASGDIAKSIELHTVIKSGDVIQMRPVEAIEVPANASVALQPGGFHVMLIGLKRDLKLGDTFDITLQFEQAGPVTVQAVVKQPE